jgi:rRNA-processing protein FCF1
MSVVYDTGVLIAADRNDRRVWAEHKVLLEIGFLPFVPSTVIAQASRSIRQAQLRRLLAACRTVPLDAAAAHQTGRLLAQSKTTDIVDANVVLVALTTDSFVIVTSDRPDIERIVNACGAKVRVRGL